MSIPASANHEEKDQDEIYPNIAAIAATYGDKNGTYLNFVKKARPGFMRDPYILWNQPWGMNEFSGKSPVPITRNSVATGLPIQNTNRTSDAFSVVVEHNSIWNLNTLAVVVVCAAVALESSVLRRY